MPRHLVRPKTCVSLVAPDSDVLRRDLREALRIADFAEIRFDHLARADIEDALRAVLPDRDRLVFTLRSKLEGGEFAGTLSEYLDTVRFLATMRPMLLDVEYVKADSMRELPIERDRVLVSIHDTTGTPPQSNLRMLLSLMRERSKFVKIVTMATCPSDGNKVLSLYKDLDPEVRLIAFAMGDLGRESRIQSGLKPNAPFTFAALHAAVAPGQLTVAEMNDEWARKRYGPGEI
jgi:3-dehydroquinate dehydratase type I